jgi:DNA helicase-2/ATP-dependent DNA helicase PcrA
MSTDVRAAVNSIMGFDLSEEQWRAASAPLAPGVIVAGAGTGKTTTMAARVAYLVASGRVRPERVLGLTFTNKATAQLLRAVRRAVAESPEPGEPEVMTYHAFGARIVNEHGMRLGLEPRTPVLTDAARWQLAYRVVCSAPEVDLPMSPEWLTRIMVELDSQITELAIDPEELIAFDTDLIRFLEVDESPQRSGEDILETSIKRRTAARLIPQWRAEKLDRGLVDYPDQIRLAGVLVDAYPSIGEQMRSRYDVVLLDEYQDTSIAQRRMLQSAFGSGFPMTAVGDPCQGIYGWRGASVENIDRFLEHFGGAEDASFTLRDNRRSGENIVVAANRASATLRARHTGIPELRATREASSVDIAMFETAPEELAWIVERISGVHGAEGETIAVLAATGGTLVRVDAALRARGIPTQVHGASLLMDQPAVLDLRAWLQVVHEPTANPAFIRLAAGPRWRLGPRDLAALGVRARLLAGGGTRSTATEIRAALADAVVGGDVVELTSLTDAVLDPGPSDTYSPEAVERLAEFAATLRELRSHTGEPLGDFVHRVASVTGIAVEALVARPDSTQHEALMAFYDLAVEFTDLDGGASLGAFLSRLDDADRFNYSTPLDTHMRSGAVQLMTIHKAKGLEFTHVVIPEVSEKDFPGGRSNGRWPTSASVVPMPLRDDVPEALRAYPPRTHFPKAKELQAYKDLLADVDEIDADRLAYVALTRAKSTLAVTGHWWDAQRTQPRGVHRVMEMLEASAPHVRVVHWAPEPPAGAGNPIRTPGADVHPWPIAVNPDYSARLIGAASDVRVAAGQTELPMGEGRRERWSTVFAALTDESHRRQAPLREVRLGDSVGATMFLRALREPEAVALDIARPMPVKPSRAARRGTAWHAWIESRYGQQSLIDPWELPGAADDAIDSDEQLEQLRRAFEQTPYAGRDPVAVEYPFSLVLHGRVIHGRIDAVFTTETGFEVVDWKTGGREHLDPGQLAIYRLAWAEVMGVPWHEVDAAFVLVASGDVLRPDTDAQVHALLGQSTRL